MARGGALLFTCAALLFAGCGETASDPAPGAELTVHASLPLRGPLAGDGRDAADGARLALDHAGGEAAGFAIRLALHDDTEGPEKRARPSPIEASANARTASEDSTSIAYLGELTSGATRASLPVTNEARILHVSPGAGALDLVAPFRGTDDVPGVQPRGQRNFGRVVIADDLQAAAAAQWASELGWRRARVVSEGSEFGETLADAFRAQAEELGLRGGSSGSKQGTYFAGLPESFGRLQDDLVLSGSSGPVQMASDAFLPPFRESVFPAVIDPTYVTSATLDPAHLPASARDFVGRFREEFGHAPGRYAATGYEAMAVILDAIERAADPADREAVTDAFFATEERRSILGAYSITEIGEPTLERVSGYVLDRGRARPAKVLVVP